MVLWVPTVMMVEGDQKGTSCWKWCCISRHGQCGVAVDARGARAEGGELRHGELQRSPEKKQRQGMAMDGAACVLQEGHGREGGEGGTMDQAWVQESGRRTEGRRTVAQANGVDSSRSGTREMTGTELLLAELAGR